jgi:hypothetical protein
MIVENDIKEQVMENIVEFLECNQYRESTIFRLQQQFALFEFVIVLLNILAMFTRICRK